MQLTINIQDFSRPVVQETNKTDYLWFNSSNFLLKIFTFFISRIKSKLNKKLDKLILVVEGFNPHIKELSIGDAEKALTDFEKVIKEMIKAKEKMDEINFFNDDDLKKKFNFSLNLLFTTESMLYKEVYKNKPFIKTPDELIDGVMRMNATNINQLLSV